MGGETDLAACETGPSNVDTLSHRYFTFLFFDWAIFGDAFAMARIHRAMSRFVAGGLDAAVLLLTLNRQNTTGRYR